MRYIFPKNWRVNLARYDQLAEALHRDARWLKESERSIPAQYHKVPLKKKNGDIRWLSVPNAGLKDIQRSILSNLFNFSFPDHIQGGISKRSIVTNASLHRGKKWIACLDISKFFPSVHHTQIKEIFLSLGCSQRIAVALTHFTSHHYELPQGAPTSPMLANLILYNLDTNIQRLCKTKHLTYSRYFDDITISGNRALDVVCDKVILIARREGFRIHKDDKEKFRKTPSWKTQTVTGIVVSRKRLEPSLDFILNFEKTIESLKIGDLPVREFLKTMATAKGMVSFLNSVNAPMAKRFQQTVERIDWRDCGLEF
jgi:retron-type reverse transcriptase